MFCQRCGFKLLPENKFCPNCGTSVSGNNINSAEVKTVSLKCKSCNGTLIIDETQEVILCPYCGGKELILESDQVKIQKIKSDAYRDVELGKYQMKMKLRQMDIDERDKLVRQSINNKTIGFVMIFGSIGVFLLLVRLQRFFGGGARLFIMLLCIGILIVGCNMMRNKNHE